MSDTTFVNGTTLSDADWFNDVNRLHYTIFGDPANIAAVVATMAASQAQQETGTSTDVFVTSGRQHHHLSAFKAWAMFGVTGNIAASYGVSSVTDVSPGVANVNWTTAFSSTSHGVFLSVRGDTDPFIAVADMASASAGSLLVRCFNMSSVETDPAHWFIGVTGDQ